MTYLKSLVPGSYSALKGYDVRRFWGDLFGALTAAVVALPLALAFGVASGAGPIAGLYGAIATGFFASVFGGTPAQISGPTGPMTVVMGAIIATHSSNLADAFTIVMLGGLLQILFGTLRIGKYVTYAPASVVSSFMSGVGIIIIIVIQALPFLGLVTSTQGVMGALTVLSTLRVDTLDLRALALGCVSLAAIVFWPKRVADLVPAPLGVLALGTAVSMLVLDGLPVIGEVPAAIPQLVVPVMSLDALLGMLQPAFILALLGSIDSLLTSLVADSVTKTRHDSDSELVGQ